MNTKADKKPARAGTDADTQRGEVLLYRTKDGKTALDVRLAGDTVWLSQKNDRRAVREERPNHF